jgi:hypothetical protein
LWVKLAPFLSVAQRRRIVQQTIREKKTALFWKRNKSRKNTAIWEDFPRYATKVQPAGSIWR